MDGRKAEHVEYTEAATLNQAAAQLLEKAKQGLYKFYNPHLDKTLAKKELSKVVAPPERQRSFEPPGVNFGRTRKRPPDVEAALLRRTPAPGSTDWGSAERRAPSTATGHGHSRRKTKPLEALAREAPTPRAHRVAPKKLPTTPSPTQPRRAGATQSEPRPELTPPPPPWSSRSPTSLNTY